MATLEGEVVARRHRLVAGLLQRDDPRDVVAHSEFPKIPQEVRLDQPAQLEDIADEVFIHRTNPRAPIGRDDDEAFALQPLQRLPRRIGTGVVSGGDVADLQPRSFGNFGP